MSRVVRFHEFGGPDVLKIEEIEVRSPGPGEIKIKVAAIGLNRAECLFREGRYLERPKELPAQIGYEASGTIEAIGEGVEGFAVADRVSTIPSFPMSKYGVYGEVAVVPAVSVAKYPENLSFEEAASIWMQYLTAYGALIQYSRIMSGDFILITAASSSVGYAAIEMVKAKGAIAIATTRTKAKKQRLLDFGADHVIVTDEEDLAERVNEITDKHGADVIFDPVAGPFIKKLADAAAPGAVIYEYGVLSLTDTPFPMFQALNKGLMVRGYSMFEVANKPDKLERAISYISKALRDGTFKPLIDRVFPFSQIVEAQRYMESNQQNGKIVVKI
jgi:NADPH:quinone reductase-like Zn-dependent oxidoreductase